jgi:hypothetical protein
MKNILIDASYLHSAYRCLKSRASSKADLINFYRFLAEIIAHKDIYINVKVDGPVYEKTAECINYLSDTSNGHFTIKLINQLEIPYKSVIDIVTEKLKSKHLAGLFSKTKQHTDIIPEFSSENPDIIFHEWLQKGEKKVPDYVSVMMGATYLPILIGHGIDLIEKFKLIKNNEWDLMDSLALASKLRSQVYLEIARIHGLNYIPSATRGMNSNWTFNMPSLRTLLFKDLQTYRDFKVELESNVSVISGVITRNYCQPFDCLKDSLELREKTTKLRNRIFKTPMLKSCDSLLSYQFNKVEELRKIKEDYLKKGDFLFAVENLNPTLSFSSFAPEVDLNINAISGIFNLLHYKRKRTILSLMTPLIVPVTQSNFTEKTKLLKKLKVNTGLHE